MSDLSTLIHRVTDDLKAIQERLNEAARPDAPTTLRDAAMDEMLNVELINDFKNSVDQMRHLLWSYIEASSSQGRQTVSDTLQSIRLRRVTDMLRILQPSVEEGRNTSSADVRSLLDVINKIAVTADSHKH